VISNLGNGVANPVAEVIRDQQGRIYGTGYDGGFLGWGTVFELFPKSASPKVLFNFLDVGLSYPEGQLWQDSRGNLFGTTTGYSVFYTGTVFELQPNSDGSWTEKTLHRFNQAPFDGYFPVCGVIPGPNGSLYGVAFDGGENYAGIVYQMVPGSNDTWTEEILHEFGTTPSDGSGPAGELTMAPDGTLYGTTFGGFGSAAWGTVFEVKP
jgi:hypothetical protein